MNRNTFFNQVRLNPFAGRLAQTQIDGVNAIVDVWEDKYASKSSSWLAYILATVFHETGGMMVPVREGFAKTDKQAQAAVTKLFNAGKISTNYSKPVNGVSYYGRGRVQNTWFDNYKKLQIRFKFPFVTKPDLLLDSKIDAEVTVVGHVEGLWTGKKLSQYFDDKTEDAIGARHIINGTDKAKLIASYYESFKQAIETAEICIDPDVTPKADGKSITQSTTVMAAGVTGAAGIAQTVNSMLEPVNTAIAQAQTTTGAISQLFNQPKAVIGVIALIAIGFGVWWIIKERIAKAKKYGI